MRLKTCALVGLLTLSAASQSLAQHILIAAEDDWYPYSSGEDGSKNPQGLTPELVKAVFATQDIEVEYITVPFSRCLHYSKIGRVVACFNVTITDSNRDEYHWHPTPMFHEGLAIFALRGAFPAGLDAQALEGHRVGITNAYTYPTSFMENHRIEKSIVASDNNLLAMLVNRRVEFIILNTLPGQLRIHKEGLSGQIDKVGMISNDGFWLAFSKTYPGGREMAQLFEQGLQELIRDGRLDALTDDFKASLGIEAAP